jgi:hypothetical protein
MRVAAELTGILVSGCRGEVRRLTTTDSPISIESRVFVRVHTLRRKPAAQIQLQTRTRSTISRPGGSTAKKNNHRFIG